MTFQNDLPNLVQSRFRGVDLDQDILAGGILIHHPVDSPELSHDFIQAFVQIIRIHTLPHEPASFVRIDILLYGMALF
jgi:hypothetical protein